MSGHSSSHRPNCQDCGAPLSGPFCSACGQHDVDYHRSIWPMAEDALEGFFHLDGKFLKSVRYLFTRPGFLSEEFVAGRRTRYTNPLRFYIFASFIFFAVQALTAHKPTPVEETAAAQRAEKASEQFKNVLQDSPQLQKTVETLKAKGVEIRPGVTKNEITVELSKDPKQDSAFERMIRANLGPDGKIDKKDMERELVHLLPPMFFFSLPILAAIFKLVNLGSRRVYVEHLVFALHVQAFAFLAALIMLGLVALARLASANAADWTGIVLWLASAWLIYRAYRRFYRQGRWKSLLRLGLGAGFYGLTLLAGVFLAAMASTYLVSRGA
jgi:hypothetical protein